MKKTITLILMLAVTAAGAGFKLPGYFDYLRVGEFNKDSTSVNWAMLDSLRARYSVLGSMSGTNLILSGYLSADSIEADHYTGVNMVLSGPLSADSVESDHGLFGVNLSSPYITTAGATGYVRMNSDSLFFTLTGGSADRDITLCLVEEDGTKHCLWWDDGDGRWEVLGNMYASNSFNAPFGFFTTNLQTPLIYSLADMALEPYFEASGLLTIGTLADNDRVLFNASQRYAIITVDSTHVMGVDGTSFYTQTGTDTLTCPASPEDGAYLSCKFTNASGGTVYGNGKNIDGAASVAASENDCLDLYYNADSGEWEIR